MRGIYVYKYFAITKYYVYCKANSALLVKDNLCDCLQRCSQNIMWFLFVPKQQTVKAHMWDIYLPYSSGSTFTLKLGFAHRGNTTQITAASPSKSARLIQCFFYL